MCHFFRLIKFIFTFLIFDFIFFHFIYFLLLCFFLIIITTTTGTTDDNNIATKHNGTQVLIKFILFIAIIKFVAIIIIYIIIVNFECKGGLQQGELAHPLWMWSSRAE